MRSVGMRSERPVFCPPASSISTLNMRPAFGGVLRDRAQRRRRVARERHIVITNDGNIVRHGFAGVLQRANGVPSAIRSDAATTPIKRNVAMDQRIDRAPPPFHLEEARRHDEIRIDGCFELLHRVEIAAMALRGLRRFGVAKKNDAFAPQARQVQVARRPPRADSSEPTEQ